MTSEHTLTRAERSFVAIGLESKLDSEVCDSNRGPAVKKKPSKKPNKKPNKAKQKRTARRTDAHGAGLADRLTPDAHRVPGWRTDAHGTVPGRRAVLAGAAAWRTDAQGAGAAAGTDAKGAGAAAQD